MGDGFSLRCKKCGKEKSYLHGIGFMYYPFLERTRKELAVGKYGKAAQSFLSDHPEGNVDAKQKIYYCPKCRYIKQGVEISITDGDNCYKKVYHCGKCRKGIMKPLDQATSRQLDFLSQIPCPECGDTDKKEVGFMLWD